MVDVDVVGFFDEKKPWSKYKDLILDYYLEPYLAKVAHLHKPIAIVDCFAGPGMFNDGERGSPVIIATRLRQLRKRGVAVRGIFIESNGVLHARLRENLAKIDTPITTRKGDFRDFVDEIASLATTHTVFVYVDPISPKHLNFNDLKAVYDKLQVGQSVETLINFLSTGFVRWALALRGRVARDGVLQTDHREVLACNEVAGGTYWQDIVFDQELGQRERIDAVADGYANCLRAWFRYVLNYRIRARYEDEQPKYHLVFGSRHPDAIDLMNRAMVKARREFVGARFVEGMLFPNEPAQEVIEPRDIERAILDTLRREGKTTWKLLRAQATISNPSLCTDSEFNRAIKEGIQSGKIGSSSAGTKVEDSAHVWPVHDPC